MKARFRGLRFVAKVSKGIGWLVLMAGLGLGVLIAQGALYFPLVPIAEPYSIGSISIAVAVFAPFLLGFLLLYGSGGAVQVLIAIEGNTRLTRQESESRPGDYNRPQEGDLG